MSKAHRIVLGVCGLGIVGAAIALNPLTASRAVLAKATETEAAGGPMQIDTVHSCVIFKIKHMGVSNFYGRINGTKGTFSLGETASFDVTVPAEKVDTGNSKRDDHVRSPDFFSAKEFPDIKFSGKDFKKSGDNTWKGTGDLTFRGVTKPVELTFTQVGAASHDGTDIAGVETTFTIKRSDFGNNKMVGPLSDEVTLTVSLEGKSK